MADLFKFPYYEVEFDKKGQSSDPDQVKALTDFLAEGTTTDLFVVSHGWNNDMAEARNLYNLIFKCVRDMLDQKKVAGLNKRKFAIMAVLWPSHKFAEKDLIPSGAASVGSLINDKFLTQELEGLKAVFDTKKGRATLDKAKLLVPKLEGSKGKKARKDFADLLRSLMTKKASKDVDASETFFKLPGDEVIDLLSKPVPVAKPKAKKGGGAAVIGGGGASRSAGGAAGLGSLLGGIKAGAAHMLNLVTYYTMKDRAGVVGSTGVNEILRSIRAKNPKLKLHLMGHSFGGRLVTSTVAGTKDYPPVKVNSLTLMQAAFSHYGFSEKYDGSKDGFFRSVVADNLVQGPLLITCTANDKANGLAYPLASMLAQQVAAGLGDKNDQYGAIGCNGAQKTPEAVDMTMGAVSASYNFEAGKLYNLNADSVIGGHSDLGHDEVAYALLTSVATT